MNLNGKGIIMTTLFSFLANHKLYEHRIYPEENDVVKLIEVGSKKTILTYDNKGNIFYNGFAIGKIHRLDDIRFKFYIDFEILIGDKKTRYNISKVFKYDEKEYRKYSNLFLSVEYEVSYWFINEVLPYTTDN